MLIGTNLKYAKAYNFRIVLETVRRFAPLSRAAIARRTELTAQTVSNITRELLEMGLIIEADRLREGRGAPARQLTLNPDGAFSIGLDLDRDHLTGVLVDFVGAVRQRIHHDLNFPLPDEAMDLMVETTQSLIQREGLTSKHIGGIGVGIPGPLDMSEGSTMRNVVNPKAFPGWHNVPVADVLHARLKLPVFLEDNAIAAAIGERWYGAGQHIPTFFYVFLGIGLGGGLIVNGQPFEGHTGNAGGLGYTYLPDPIEPDESALFKRPHVGILFNLPRLYRLLEKEGITVSQPTDLEALYHAGNPTLLHWLDVGANHLAPVILSIEYLIDPEAIFFGGRWPEVLIADLMKRISNRLPTMRIEDKSASPTLRTATAGQDAAALGVATLPLFTSFAPAPKILLKNASER